jgi:hypothetical protein
MNKPKPAALKYSFSIPIIYLLFFSACQDRQMKTKETGYTQRDTIKTESKQIAADTQNNLVKSEATDALTKKEQGYALPRFDDGLAQSPINMLSSGAKRDNKDEVALIFYGEINAVENLGHTIQLDFTEGSTTIVKRKIYQFKQLYFSYAFRAFD